MLFTNSATSTNSAGPSVEGASTYSQPSACTSGEPITAIRAVAPPGGCSVRVACISAIAVDTASGAASQGVAGRRVQQATPTLADNACPPTTLRGWASGLRGAPKISAADAPIDPIINIRSAPASKAWFANQAAMMPTKEPIQLHAISDALTRGGPPRALPRIAVEAGVTDGWWKYGCAAVIGIDRYGESAPGPALFEHFHFTAQNVAATVRKVLHR